MKILIVIVIVATFVLIVIAKVEDRKGNSPIPEQKKSQQTSEKSYNVEEPKETWKEILKERRQLSQADEDRKDKTIFFFYVKGIEYRKDDQIQRAKTLKNGEKVNLVPQPDNIYDHNAIMVITKDNFLIGYVPKKDAAKMKQIFETNEDNIVVKNYEYDGQTNIAIKSTFNSVPIYDNEEIISSKYRTEIAPHKYKWWTQAFMMDYLVHPKEFLDKMTEKYEEDPEDLFIAFNYLKAVDRVKKGDEVIQLARKIGQKFNIIENKEIKNIIKEQIVSQRYIEAAEQRTKSSEQYKEARVLFGNREYEKALPIFMDVMNSYYKIQATPKNICKCYIELKRYDMLDEFIKQAINEKWLTESTKEQLLKYKNKYCRS